MITPQEYYNTTQSTPSGRVAVRYPSPFFSLSQIYIPQDIRSLFELIRYYVMTYGLLYTYVTKMSDYSLTRLIFGGDEEATDTDQNLRVQWERLFFEDLDFYYSIKKGGLHFWSYGNWYTSVRYPFDRWLICPLCKHPRKIHTFKKDEYKWRQNHFFEGRCRSCGKFVRFHVDDRFTRSTGNLRFLVWNPEQMYPRYNEATGDTEYYYQLSDTFRERVRKGERMIIERTPAAFLEAARTNGFVKIHPSNLVHIKAPSPDSRETGIGHPPTLAALKDVFQGQLMLRAQEANLVERTVPLGIVHPLPIGGDRSSNPMFIANLEELLEKAKEEIVHARRDLNYIAVSPVPLGVTHLWGDGRNLLLVTEIRQWMEIISMDLGIPSELLFGGVSWTGSNVSLRMLENQILSFTNGYNKVTRFYINSIARFLQWERPPWAWAKFKMADDIQYKQQLLTMSQMGKVSDRTLYAAFDLRTREERESLQKDAAWMATMQREAARQQARTEIETMRIRAKSQESAHQPMFPPGMEEQAVSEQAPPGMAPEGQEDMDYQSFVERSSQMLATLPPDQQNALLNQIGQQHPEIADALASRVQSMGSSAPSVQTPMPNPAQQGLMQPMPEQRSPRRGPETAAI